MSVTRTATAKDYLEDHKVMCCPVSIRRTIVTMLDMSLLKSPSFLLLSISGFFTVLGMYAPFIYIEARALKHHIHEDTAVFLMTLVGITNTAGRIICGIISSFPKASPITLSYISLIMCGTATILSVISITTTVQYAYACVFGITVGNLYFNSSEEILNFNIYFSMFFFIKSHRRGRTCRHSKIDKRLRNIDDLSRNCMFFGSSTCWFAFGFYRGLQCLLLFCWIEYYFQWDFVDSYASGGKMGSKETTTTVRYS